jgi:CheY-like chemotaxis protein
VSTPRRGRPAFQRGAGITLHVLVVEPDGDRRDIFAEYLRHRGAHAIAVPDATHALLALGTERVDLLVCDGSEGLALARHVRDENARLPIVVLGPAELEEGALAVPALFLARPFLLDDLEAAMLEALAAPLRDDSTPLARVQLRQRASAPRVEEVVAAAGFDCDDDDD